MVYLYQYIPNLLTFLRIASAPFLWQAIMSRDVFSAGALLLFAVVSDFGDGYLARRLFITSRTGSFLDPLADKVVVIAAFEALWQLGLTPLWVLLVIALRDGLVTFLRTLLLRQGVSLRTSFFAKSKTAFQFGVLFISLLFLDVHQVPSAFLYFVQALVAGLTVVSAAPYVHRYFFICFKRGFRGR